MRRNGKKQKVIVMTSMIALVFLFSVGYAAFSSDFLISGKGTIVGSGETASETLIAKAVTTGDGLYVDSYEEGRYVYRGASPDNYIWLDLNGDSSKTDNETYRIVAVESDNTIKVVADTSIGNMVFDPGYSTSITGVTSANSTTGTRYSSTSTDYCYGSSASSYSGCNVWGSKTTMLDSSGNNVTAMPREAGSTTTYILPTSEAYVNTYLNTTFLNSIDSNLQNKIVTHTYNVGPLANISGQTLATDISQESAYKWEGKVGLINATDYVRASTSASCTGVYSYYATSGCYDNSATHNYLFNSADEWTLSPYFYNGYSYFAWMYFSYGDIGFVNGGVGGSYGIAPTLYLSSDITLTGTGSSGDPYEIAN